MTFLSQLKAPSMMTDLEFCHWAGEAMPGDHLVYHRGFLGRDLSSDTSPLSKDAQLRLAAVAESARWAFEKCLVHLVQVRCGPENFAYLAIARPKPFTERPAHPFQHIAPGRPL